MRCFLHALSECACRYRCGWILDLSERAPALRRLPRRSVSCVRSFSYAIRLPPYHDATVRDNRNPLAFTLDDSIYRLLQHSRSDSPLAIGGQAKRVCEHLGVDLPLYSCNLFAERCWRRTTQHL